MNRPSSPLMVAFGGGVNSTAMLVGMAQREIRPDAILFADTGGEKPETYNHVLSMSAWCERNGFPAIVVVRNEGMYPTLEEKCLRLHTLPSLAYGMKSCSSNYKRDPQNKWANHWPVAQAAWKRGDRVTKALGYDADEAHRAQTQADAKYIKWYPLIEWDWDRDECVRQIQGAGLAVPSKSSCFFCPGMTKREIVAMGRDHPDLLQRALALEANAEGNVSVAGLGRRFSWQKFISADCAQQRLFPEAMEMPCSCFDGATT